MSTFLHQGFPGMSRTTETRSSRSLQCRTDPRWVSRAPKETDGPDGPSDVPPSPKENDRCGPALDSPSLPQESLCGRTGRGKVDLRYTEPPRPPVTCPRRVSETPDLGSRRRSYLGSGSQSRPSRAGQETGFATHRVHRPSPTQRPRPGPRAVKDPRKRPVYHRPHPAPVVVYDSCPSRGPTSEAGDCPAWWTRRRSGPDSDLLLLSNPLPRGWGVGATETEDRRNEGGTRSHKGRPRLRVPLSTPVGPYPGEEGRCGPTSRSPEES